MNYLLPVACGVNRVRLHNTQIYRKNFIEKSYVNSGIRTNHWGIHAGVILIVARYRKRLITVITYQKNSKENGLSEKNSSRMLQLDEIKQCIQFEKKA